MTNELEFTPSVYDQVIKLGIQHSAHESDLYIPVNSETMTLVKNYRFRCNVTTFISNIDGKLWYDIPFAYLPFWRKRA